MAPPPFNLEESTFLVQPKLPATDDLYPNAMAMCNADAEKAQLALGSKYVFSPAQWLVFWRKAEGQSAKAGLRCVIQIGTIFAVLTGRYKSPFGEIKLSRTILRQATIDTKLYDASTIMAESAKIETTNNSLDEIPSKSTTLSNRIRAAALSTGSLELGPKVIVVEGDTMNVALQLRRIFKHTPAAVIPINGSIPGGFYRRGGATPEEEICRRSNLWDCLDDPYKHSIPEKTDKVEKSLPNLNTKSTTRQPPPLSKVQKRSWSYPISENQAVYAPGIYIFRGSESEGYPFLKNPGRVSCICVVPDMNRDNLDNKERANFPKINSSSNSIAWKGGRGRDRDVRMSAKATKAYAKKIEFALRVAINEGRRILILSALGCGAHGTPPKHAAEIYRETLSAVDPKGEFFDLVAFAILEDQNSFKGHNPEGNISPFAEVLTGGVVTPIVELESTTEVSEGEDFYSKMRSKDSIFGRSSKDTLSSTSGSNASSKETLTNSSGSLTKSVKFSSKSDLKTKSISDLPRKVGLVSQDFPPEELLTHNHTPLAKGWRSERFCIYPQVLILRLAPGKCRLRKIQILSHHFMVATKLEFYVGRSVRPLGTVEKGIVDEVQTHDPALIPAASWNDERQTRLASGSVERPGTADSTKSDISPKMQLEDVELRNGEGKKKIDYVSLSDNSDSNYRARELKSIHIDAEGDYVKLLIHKNYINTLNLYNQVRNAVSKPVGIVAINILGDIMDSDYFVNSVTDAMKTLAGLDPLQADPEWQPPHSNENAALWGSVNQQVEEKPTINVKDLAFSIYHDEDVAKLIEMILRSKDNAVKAENFALAKSLKTLYQLSKKAGEEIAKLQVTKAQAVELEDYEMAEDVKSDISYIKLALKEKMFELGLEEKDSYEIIPRDIPRSIEHPVGLDVLRDAQPTSDRPRSAQRTPSPGPVTSPLHILQPIPRVESQQVSIEPTSVQDPSQIPSKAQPPPVLQTPSKLSSQQYQAPTVTQVTQPKMPFDSTPIPTMVPKKDAPNTIAAGVAPTASGVDAPEPLTEEQSDEHEKLIRIFGAFVVRCILSRQFKLREWAFEEVSKRLEAWESRRKRRLSRTHMRKASQNSLQHEKRKAGGLTRGREALKGPSKGRKAVSWSRSSSRDSPQSSDGNESEGSVSDRDRIKISFSEEVKVTPVDEESFVSACFEVVKKGLDDSREKVAMLALSFWDQLTRLIEQWRYVKARLEALSSAVKTFGIDSEGRHLLGLSLEAAIQFAEPQLHHKNFEVRESAVKVIVELVLRSDEDSVSPFLQNVKPQLLETIKDKITEAKGKTVKPKTKKKHPAPWKENLLADEESNAEVVGRLKEEINSLRTLVEGGGAGSKPQTRGKSTMSPKPAKAKLVGSQGTKSRQTPHPPESENYLSSKYEHGIPTRHSKDTRPQSLPHEL
ncbi:hypothetical protein HDU97_007124 [Phlyctochytrium planicorne]|nr:hypothetical protein HDU97_007124 [Phlyctochytrium planicorne]